MLSAGSILLLLLRWLLSSTNQPPAATDLTDLIALIEATNRDSAVMHQLEFSLAADHIPIVLYVYNRPGYLKKVHTACAHCLCSLPVHTAAYVHCLCKLPVQTAACTLLPVFTAVSPAGVGWLASRAWD